MSDELSAVPLVTRLEAAIRAPELFCTMRAVPISPVLPEWMTVTEPSWRHTLRAVNFALTSGELAYVTTFLAVFEQDGEPFIRLFNEVRTLRDISPYDLGKLAEALLAVAHRLRTMTSEEGKL